MMISKNIVEFENEKFIRIKIQKLSINELFNILINPDFIVFFAVFDKNQYYTRYKIQKIHNIIDLYKLFENGVFNDFDSSIDSGNININEAVYIDCYKYPK